MGSNDRSYTNPMHDSVAVNESSGIDVNGPPSFELYEYFLARAAAGHYDPRLDELEIILGMRYGD